MDNLDCHAPTPMTPMSLYTAGPHRTLDNIKISLAQIRADGRQASMSSRLSFIASCIITDMRRVRRNEKQTKKNQG